MKKLRGIVVSLVLSALLVLPVSASSFSTDLKYGMSNNSDVKRLQEYLKGEKLYTGPISGNYYSLTKTAVSKLQKKNKLKVTGKFDLVTRNNVNSLLAKNDLIDDGAQKLAESIDILKQQAQSDVMTPEQFALLYPNIQPLRSLPITIAQDSSITSSNFFETTPQTQDKPIASTYNPTPQSTITTTTSSTPISSKIINNINWTGGINISSPSIYNQDLPNNNYQGRPGEPTAYPYYYFVNCDPNDPDNSWKTKNVTDSTYGRGSVITNNSRNEIGSFWINGVGLINNIDQYNGPFIKSVTIKNLGTADISKIGLYGYFQPVISQESWKEIMSSPYAYSSGWRIDPVSFNPTFNGQEATFVLPTTFKVDNSTTNIPRITTSTKQLDLHFKIDSSKMNRGETLSLQVTSAELASLDQTKNYIFTLPYSKDLIFLDLPILIKCDVRI